MRNLGGI